MNNIVDNHYECIEEFCNEVDFVYNNIANKYNSTPLQIIAKYKDVKEIIKKLCRLGYELCSIEIEPPKHNGYKYEYVINICDDGLCCNPLKVNNKYVNCNSIYTFIFEDCNSKILSHINSIFIREVDIYDREHYIYDDIYNYVLDDFEFHCGVLDDERDFISNDFINDNTGDRNAKELKEIAKVFGL